MTQNLKNTFHLFPLFDFEMMLICLDFFLMKYVQKVVVMAEAIATNFFDVILQNLSFKLKKSLYYS